MTATATATTVRPVHRSRPAHVALWVLQVLLAALFLFSASGKFAAEPQTVAGFELMGLGGPGMYAIGVLEVLGAVGLLVARLTGLAALGLVALMTGAVILTVVFVGAAMAGVPGPVLVLVAIVAWGRRESTRALLHRR
jgi:uncharacterized membrane protein YphA (DoxX/SURF4 family)